MRFIRRQRFLGKEIEVHLFHLVRNNVPIVAEGIRNEVMMVKEKDHPLDGTDEGSKAIHALTTLTKIKSFLILSSMTDTTFGE